MKNLVCVSTGVLTKAFSQSVIGTFFKKIGLVLFLIGLKWMNKSAYILLHPSFPFSLPHKL